MEHRLSGGRLGLVEVAEVSSCSKKSNSLKKAYYQYFAAVV